MNVLDSKPKESPRVSNSEACHHVRLLNQLYTDVSTAISSQFHTSCLLKGGTTEISLKDIGLECWDFQKSFSDRILVPSTRLSLTHSAFSFFVMNDHVFIICTLYIKLKSINRWPNPHQNGRITPFHNISTLRTSLPEVSVLCNRPNRRDKEGIYC
jgi:hypothetical protein